MLRLPLSVCFYAPSTWIDCLAPIKAAVIDIDQFISVCSVACTEPALASPVPNSSHLDCCDEILHRPRMPHHRVLLLCRMSKNFRRAMNALPSVKFTVVATTPLEALADRLHSTISLDMTWAPGHMCQVSVLRAHLIYGHLIIAVAAAFLPSI
jgi:hypothetical protein